jgi:quinol monooxygenase YgiN
MRQNVIGGRLKDGCYQTFETTSAARKRRKPMKAIPLLVGACLFSTGAVAQSVKEQKMADECAPSKMMKAAVGSPEVYWSATFAIPPGKMDNFKQVVAKLVADTKKEPGTLEYEYTTNSEENTVDIIERYRDSDAVIAHVTQTFPKYAKEFLENARPGRVVVYGSPSDEVKKALKDFNPVYFTSFNGFTR